MSHLSNPDRMKKNVFALFFCLLCLTQSAFSQIVWNENCQLARFDGYIDFDTNHVDEINLLLNKWMDTQFTALEELPSTDEIVKKQYKATGTIELTADIHKTTKIEFVFIVYLQKNRLVYTAKQFLLIEHSTKFPEKEPTYTDLNQLYERQFKKKSAKTDVQVLMDEKLGEWIETLTKSVREIPIKQ